MKKQSILFWLAAVCLINYTCAAVRAENQINAGAIASHESSVDTISSEKPSVRIDRCGGLSYVVGSVLINAPRDTVWDRLSNYDKATEIFDNLSVCKVIGTEGEVKLLRATRWAAQIRLRG